MNTARCLGLCLAVGLGMDPPLWAAQPQPNGDAPPGPASMQVVVSVRHLKPTGRSYHHLELYAGDGRLIRQLTDAPADDLEPRFSRDGDEVAFERWSRAGRARCVLRIADLSLRSVPKFPYWHDECHEQDDFHSLDSYRTWGAADRHDPSARYMPAPDDSVDLLIKEVGDYIDDQQGWVRDRSTGKVTPISSFDGFAAFGRLMVANKSPFLVESPLRVFFFRIHQGSTYGGSFHAVDLNRRRIVRITEHGGSIIPLVGRAGFFCISQERYQPLGDGRTVNCSYLDWWDPELNRTRFSAALSRFGGASVFHGSDQWPLQIRDFEGRNWLP